MFDIVKERTWAFIHSQPSFFTVKKMIYKNTITQRLQQACTTYPFETDVSENLWVKDVLWNNSI